MHLLGGKLTGTTTLKGGTVTVGATGIKAAKLTAAKTAAITYDARSLKPGNKTAMLVGTRKQALEARFSVIMTKLQKFGAYRLSSNFALAAKTAFTIKFGSTKKGVTELGGTPALIQGVEYAVSSKKDNVILKLSAVPGNIFTSEGPVMKGTANCDIFYGCAGNDIASRKNIIEIGKGHDVTVYDKKDWGEDVIKQTKGTMTLVFAGVKKGQITKTLSGSTMTITRNSDPRQKITIKGWNDLTHDIVFTSAGALKAFNTYVNMASLQDDQRQAAQDCVFKAAKLA